MPETWAQATVILALVVPGFVYRVSRQAVAGPDPETQELDVRILHAIVATAAFAGVYALTFGTVIRDYVLAPDRALDDIRAIGLYFVIFALLVPWSVARVRYYLETSQWYLRTADRLVTLLRLRPAFDPTPSAWDFAFSRGTASWVRVRYPDGRWLGGWFGDRSWASSFPNPKELYVQEGWVINDDGTFSDIIHAPGGMIIRCADAVSVDFIPAEADTGLSLPTEQESEADR